MLISCENNNKYRKTLSKIFSKIGRNVVYLVICNTNSNIYKNYQIFIDGDEQWKQHFHL